MLKFCLQDSACNVGRPHIQAMLFLLRASSYFRSKRQLLVRYGIGYPLSLIYRMLGLFVLSIDIPVSTSIGPNLSIHHGMGLVVNCNSIIGSNVTLRHNVTLGADKIGNCPELCDGASIGPNSVLIGGITIGSDSVVGAGSVVIRDVANRDVVAGNPARSVVRK